MAPNFLKTYIFGKFFAFKISTKFSSTDFLKHCAATYKFCAVHIFAECCGGSGDVNSPPLRISTLNSVQKLC